MSIRIVSAALEKVEGSRIILRGVIEVGSLSSLRVDDYQREELPFSSLKSILSAFEEGEVLPDIELGMRGRRFQLRDGVYHLQDDVYIIDGLQRTTAAKIHSEKDPAQPVRLGVKIYFDTTKEWERELFIILNTKRVRVSPDKIIFNRRETSDSVGMLYRLTAEDKAFALYDKVSWRQHKGSKFIGAFTVSRLICALHVHKANGLSSDKDEVVRHLDRIRAEVGAQIMADNVRTFFDVVDWCWGLRNLEHYKKAPQIKSGFLYVLARFLSEHQEFWRSDDKRLFVDVPLRKALKKFNVYEPTHANLCSSSGKALDQLREYLVLEVNRGKRGKRLVPRTGRYLSLVAAHLGDSESEFVEMEAEENMSDAAE